MGRVLGIKQNINFPLALLLGAFAVAMMLSLWAFVFAIDRYSLLGSSALSLAVYATSFGALKDLVKRFFQGLRSLSSVSKLAGSVFVLLIGIWAALPTNIPDHGLYYLQTIKWLTAVGLQEDIIHYGLALGQQSPWHMLQALFSGEGVLPQPIYTINGWLLLVVLMYFMDRAKKPDTWTARYAWAVIVLLPVFSIVTTAPTPDLVVWLFSLILLDPAYLRSTEDQTVARLAMVLALAAFFVKLTAFYLLFWVLLVHGPGRALGRSMVVLSTICLFILVFKNIWVSSSPIFPFADPTGWFTTASLDKAIYQHAADTRAQFQEYLKVEMDRGALWQVGYRLYFWLFAAVGLAVLAWIAFKKEIRLKPVLFVLAICLIVVMAFSPDLRFIFGLLLVVTLLLVSRFIKATPYWVLLGSVLVGMLWLSPSRKVVLSLSSSPIVRAYYPLDLEYLLKPAPTFVLNSYEQGSCFGRDVLVAPPVQYCWGVAIPCVQNSHYQEFCTELEKGQ